MFGSEYALKTYNKKIYEKYLESGKNADEYFKEYFDQLFAKREGTKEKKEKRNKASYNQNNKH